MMENTNIIYRLEKVQAYLEDLKNIEEDRLYCRHDIYHFLTTGRIAYILTLENGLDVSRDLVYTTALLHDLSKAVEDREGLSHSKYSARLAEDILDHTNFSKGEKDLIIQAIRDHSGWDPEPKLDTFPDIFRYADNLSRDCYNCTMADSCKWEDARKNFEISY